MQDTVIPSKESLHPARVSCLDSLPTSLAAITLLSPHCGCRIPFESRNGWLARQVCEASKKKGKKTLINKYLPFKRRD